MEQALFVQHLISLEPGQSPEVITLPLPEQQLFAIETQTPSTPPALHVAVYGQVETVEISQGIAIAKEAVAAAVAARKRLIYHYVVDGVWITHTAVRGARKTKGSDFLKGSFRLVARR